MDIVSESKCKAYSRKLLASATSGFKSATSSNDANGNPVLTIEFNDGTKVPLTFPKPADGVGITDVDIITKNNKAYFKITLSNGTIIDDCEVPSGSGGGVEFKDWSSLTGYKVGDKVVKNKTLYQCIKDHTSTSDFSTDLADGDWEIYIGGSGGSGQLQSALTTNVEVGGIPSNKTYATGTDYETLFKDLLVKYIKAGISISISPSTTVYEIGDTIASLVVTAKLTKNSEPISNTKFYVGGTLVNTDTTQTGSGNVTYTHSTAITSDTDIKAVVNDGKSDTTSNVISIKFVNAMYVGLESGTLTKLVRVKGNYTYSNITCSNDSVIFKYPSSYGDLKSILDPNGFENLGAFTKTTETIDGVAYNVYTSGKATLSGFSYTFKF